MYKKPWIGPDDLHQGRLVGGVLERHADKDEDEQADSDHIGHGPVAEKSRSLRPVHLVST